MLSGDADVYRRLLGVLTEHHGRQIFSTDGSTIDDQLIDVLDGRSIATAESCTGGLIAARLTSRPGSSDYVMGGVVSYSNDAKSELIDVPAGPPLGTGLGGYELVTRSVTADDTLLLYTDGLVERRGEDIDESLARLTRIRVPCRTPVEDMVDAVAADRHHRVDRGGAAERLPAGKDQAAVVERGLRSRPIPPVEG